MKTDPRRKEHYDSQEEIFRVIAKKGFADFSASLPVARGAFDIRERGLHCIDEGTPWGIHAAGSGILQKKNKLISALREAGVTEVTSHDGCGAAKLYARLHGLDETRGDDLGRAFAIGLSVDLGVPYRHISFAEMKRPPEFHVSRVLYYDGTGKFGRHAHAPDHGFPQGFIISRKFHSKKVSLEEAAISLGIAFGAGGFGSLLLEKGPFYMVAIGESPFETKQLMKELQSLDHSYGDCVVVDGFERSGA